MYERVQAVSDETCKRQHLPWKIAFPDGGDRRW
jgi:hypothetical protein